MGFYQNPIGPPDPFDKYKVESAAERQSRADPFQSETGPPKDRRGLVAELLRALQKAVDYFLQRHADPRMDRMSAKKSLMSLKQYFATLQQEDRSQDVDFLNELSKAWNQALEESSSFNEAAALKFKILTKQILSYPENHLHTFGYYLTEYAGQKWVPFPYMELVQKIHYEHEHNAHASALTEWVLLTEETIELLNDK